jgi:NhaC family Na+:H+ antiporter
MSAADQLQVPQDEGAGPSPRPVRPPTLADALIPLVTLAVLLGLATVLFAPDPTNGPLQVALLLSAMVAALVVMKNGSSWAEVAAAGTRSISSVMSAIFILLGVGALIGTWNIAGTIPTLVAYGIQLLQPGWFYPASALICGAVALSVGSSWTTAGTIGVGLVGIAAMIGVSPAITAGAVISGAYLGDKLSPLSATTSISAKLVDVDVFAHVRRLAWSAGPAFLGALIVYTILALSGGPATSEIDKAREVAAIERTFNVSPLNLLPLLFLVVLSVRGMPPTLAVMLAALFGGLTAVVLQPQVVVGFVDDASLPLPLVYLKGVWMVMANGFVADTGDAALDALLSRGGMDSMLSTVWIILGAASFGGILEHFGLLARILYPVLKEAKSTGKLFLTVVGTAFGVNVITGEQYLSILLPEQMYRVEFARRGLAPVNLSATTAAAGTGTSPLVPWNSCGAYMAAVLGVPVLVYVPYAFFNFFNPALAVLYGFTGFRVVRMPTPSRSGESGPADRVAKETRASTT